jgi:hypothetical protein
MLPRRRAAVAAILATLIAAAPIPGLPVAAASNGAGSTVAPDVAAASGPKIVIVVGAVESVTPTFRADADAIYAEAIKYTSNVVKVYSPNATWAAVKAAAQGASIFIYLGHGYGFPSPYKTILTPSVHDGMGLNHYGGIDDWDKKYYGESYVGSEIRLAKDAIVILNHLCYSAGSSESGNPEPTIPVAKQRVDNFASGFLRTGARAVIADAYTGSVEEMIRGVFTTHQSLGTLWHSLISAHHHDIAWTPLRNPAYRAVMDPDTTTTGFHRSIVGNLDLQTDAIVAGASAPRTDTDPAALLAPGAAAVTAASLPVFSDATLGAETGGQLAAGARLRVDELQPATTAPDGSTTPAAADIHTLDGSVSGWVASDGLVPRDSAPPELWAMDGVTTLSPNFDGVDDRLNLVARFSESATWTIRVLDAGNVSRGAATGTGGSAAFAWSPLVGGVALADGDYSWTLHATDGWGNVALDASGPIVIANAPVPPTGVLAFVPITPTLTNATTLSYGLTFAGDVTGLSASDFTVTGSAPGCVVGTPTGSGTSWTVTVGSCSSGKVTLTLEPGTVAALVGGSGPGGAITAHYVLIDRLAPKASAPKANLRYGLALGSALAATLTWTATDTGGAGVKAYDVARSTDGGAFAVIATGLTAASLNVSAWPGHTYRFEVRATDKASNRGAWVAGPTLYPALVQQTSTNVGWSGSWTTLSSTSYSGGSARSSVSAGAAASYAFSGRSIGFVVTRCTDCGQVKVFVDGSYVVTIDTYAASTAYRWVAYSRTFSSYGSHTVKLVVVGTAGRPKVVLDAFTLLR